MFFFLKKIIQKTNFRYRVKFFTCGKIFDRLIFLIINKKQLKQNNNIFFKKLINNKSKQTLINCINARKKKSP